MDQRLRAQRGRMVRADAARLRIRLPPQSRGAMTTLHAQPEPVQVDLSNSAVVVVDMQNGFASQGGMLDLAGADLSRAPQVVQSVGAVVDAARRAGIQVIYLRMGYRPDLSNGGGPESPNWH